MTSLLPALHTADLPEGLGPAEGRRARLEP